MQSSPSPSRRTFTKSVAWAVPAVAASVAAPAVALSPSDVRDVPWTSFPTPGLFSNKRDGEAEFDGGVATLSRSGRTNHSDTFTTDGSQNGFLRLRSNTPLPIWDPSTTAQTLNLSFSVEVRELTFTVYDIDRHQPQDRETPLYEDLVYFTSTPPTELALGSEIEGSGRDADPLRMKRSLEGGNMPGMPNERDAALYKVDLYWDKVPAGATISLVYAQRDWSSGVTPTIWLSNLRFGV